MSLRAFVIRRSRKECRFQPEQAGRIEYTGQRKLGMSGSGWLKQGSAHGDAAEVDSFIRISGVTQCAETTQIAWGCGRPRPQCSRARVKALDSIAFLGESRPTQQRTGIFAGGAWLRVGMKPVILEGI
jgi:hypothetical protein